MDILPFWHSFGSFGICMVLFIVMVFGVTFRGIGGVSEYGEIPL